MLVLPEPFEPKQIPRRSFITHSAQVPYIRTMAPMHMNTCRICYEPGSLISVCQCAGSCASVHFECIQKWIMISRRKKCEICHHSYIYPGLVLPKTLNQVRLKNASIVSFLVGFVHGFTIWFDSNANLKYIWIYIISCLLFNFSFVILLSSLYKFNMRFWKVILYFYMAFVIGNLPGHVLTEKITWQVGFCYAFNAICMFICLAIENRLQFRQPAHQNDIIVNNPTHNQ